MKKGYWIALEGGDGSGKTTVQERLAVKLAFEGYDVITTREPGGNEYSEAMRQLIFSPTIKEDPKSQLLGFILARRRNIIETIIPALEQGKIIISDRSENSSFAYQAFEYGLDFDLVQQINNFGTDGIKPDLTLLLDVEISTGIARVQQAKSIDANYFDHSRIEGLEKRQNGYLEMAKNYQKYQINPWIIIDANQDLETVCEQSTEAVTKFIDSK